MSKMLYKMMTEATHCFFSSDVSGLKVFLFIKRFSEENYFLTKGNAKLSLTLKEKSFDWIFLKKDCMLLTSFDFKHHKYILCNLLI